MRRILQLSDMQKKELEDRQEEQKLREAAGMLQGGYGYNPIRLAIFVYLISQLTIPEPLKLALETAMRPRTIIYDDAFFRHMCDTFFEQKGVDAHTEAANDLGREIVMTLSQRGHPASKIAESLFPTFGYFMTEEEMPELHRCVVF